MNNKEKFLRENIGFHLEDLSLTRQAELFAIKDELNVSDDWMMLALSKGTKADWERWGFNLLKKPDFKKEVDTVLAQLDTMEDRKFRQERQKNRKGKELHTSYDTFLRCWNGVMEQGRLYTPQEAAAAGLSSFWTYGYALKDISYINTIVAVAAQPTDPDEQLKFVLSVQKITM